MHIIFIFPIISKLKYSILKLAEVNSLRKRFYKYNTCAGKTTIQSHGIININKSKVAWPVKLVNNDVKMICQYSINIWDNL